MRILLLASAFNSLTQRVFVELDDRGHDVGAAVVSDGQQMRDAVAAFEPELIVAPYLKTAIPEDLWRARTCLIVHPGIRGDRGASSLDWAILRGLTHWGVTVLQAAEEFDAGDIWALRTFRMRDVAKSALYRHEVADAAVAAVVEAVSRVRDPGWTPQPLDYEDPQVEGGLEPFMKQDARAIDWNAPTETVMRHLRCADSTPGVLDTIFGRRYQLFGGHVEYLLRGRPGEVLAHRDGAVCRATGDGAVWISHVSPAPEVGQAFVKLPASLALAGDLGDILESRIEPDAVLDGPTYREIRYEERSRVGYLHFEFYNGAMSTEQCVRLTDAYRAARRRPTLAIVLMGGTDLWSNGLHLNVIETAADPAQESWANINAMDDLVEEILQTPQIVISALAGNAGAGGVPLALAADEVWAREGVVLNPHYKGMELFGSEYWTYLFPKRVGPAETARLTETCLPLSACRAKSIGLVDEVFGGDAAVFQEHVAWAAEGLAGSCELAARVRDKRGSRLRDEDRRPLAAYRYEELARMRRDFASIAYQRARQSFVLKQPSEPFSHPAAVGPVIMPSGALAANQANPPAVTA